MAEGHADAFATLGSGYMLGHWGLQPDHKDGLKLLERAVELGSTDAHYHIGCFYDSEIYGAKDCKKAASHWKKAAIGGDEGARLNLGCYEYETGNVDRAVRHFMILAKCGYKKGLDYVKECFLRGVATKAQFEEALRGYPASEVHSAQRKEAAVFLRSIKE